MDEIKIRFLDSHAEFPCMSLSQAKFNILGDYLWLSSTKQANWGHRFLFKKKKKTEKRSSGLNASSALQTGSLRENTVSKN